MKKLIALLPILFTALIAIIVTYFVVTKIDSVRRDRDAEKYEAVITNLEAKIFKLENPTAAPAAATNAAPTVTRVRYNADTVGSKCRIDGTSSIHDWKMETAIIGGFFEIDSRATFDMAQSTLGGAGDDGRISSVAEVTIPVRSLKSYNTRMDEVYQDHMEAITYRKIDYRLQTLTLKKTTHAANTPFEFDSTGNLIVHGVTKTIAMPVKIERLDANRLKITGKTPLKMTDYKVNPPCPNIPGIGQITTGDDITVTFEWIVTPAEGNSAPK